MLVTQADEEPKTRMEALACQNTTRWQATMDEEIESSTEAGTWDLTQAYVGKNIVGSKWVYKVKKNEKGEITKYKAWIVAQDFS